MTATSPITACQHRRKKAHIRSGWHCSDCGTWLGNEGLPEQLTAVAPPPTPWTVEILQQRVHILEQLIDTGKDIERNLYAERDALRGENTRLREALETIKTETYWYMVKNNIDREEDRQQLGKIKEQAIAALSNGDDHG